jgi:dienelactone hydrolase
MARLRRRAASAALAATLLTAAACADDGSGGAPHDIVVEVVSDESTQDIRVYEPKAGGPWPVVLALHGINGSAEDLDGLATRLAAEGFVVFAPSYRTGFGSDEATEQMVSDVECGYRFARTIAADHGGDLDEPVTFVGWSLGATLALATGLIEEIDPNEDVITCFDQAPRPDVVVAISGCHYEFDGSPTGFDPAGFDNHDTDVVLLAGSDDAVCEASQSEDAATALRETGFDADLTVLDGASHASPIFRDIVDDELVEADDADAGEQTLQLILDAVDAAKEVDDR